MLALILLSEWQSSQVEFWKPIADMDGYDVSNFGNVRSWWTGYGKSRQKSETPRLLVKTLSGNGKGYLVVTFPRAAKNRQRRVQRVVAMTFIPNPDNHPDVNHKNGIKADNRSDNLEWLSLLGNQQHAWANGLKDDQLRKTRRYTEAAVEELRQRVAAGEVCVRVAKELGISSDMAHRIVHYKAYRRKVGTNLSCHQSISVVN